MTDRPHEFTAKETGDLLDELGVRLRERGVAASIFVVGGAAIAVNHSRLGRVTQDIDGLANSSVVFEEARRLAQERDLPENWLNSNAGMWMPPLPRGVLDPPAVPGLRVTYADDRFLLATKLIAQRPKDTADVVLLAERVGLAAATPEQLEAHIRSYYTDPGTLEFIVDGDDVDRELRLLAQDAARLLERRAREVPRHSGGRATDLPTPHQP